MIVRGDECARRQQPKTMKSRRGLEDVLVEEFLKRHFTCTIRDASDRERMRRVL